MEILIKDETATGQILNKIAISINSERTTVQDIIEARIHKEVERYNSKADDYTNGLVIPTEIETQLNQAKAGQKRKLVDPEKQCYIALEAFQQNGFFVLIDNEQAEELDKEVLLGPNTEVSFIKLTPLVGG